MVKKRGIVAITLGLSVLSTPVFAKGPITAPHVPGELIVKVKEGKIANFFSEKSLKGIAINRSIDVSFGNYFVVKVGVEKGLANTIERLEALSYVEYAEPNFLYTIVDAKKNLLQTIASQYAEVTRYNDAPVNDPKYDQLWGLNNTGDNDPSSGAGGVVGADVDAEAAWAKYGKGHRGVKIAVIDTGVDYNHPDLANNMWVNEAEANGEVGVDDDGNGFVDDIHGYDFANTDGDPLDGHGHGTHCSGTIAAEHDNGIGVAGVMGEASIVAIKFLTDSGSGSTEGAIKSINYATMMNVDLMSNSWGGGGFSQALKDAITEASEKGIVFTAAAGNSNSDNDSSPHYPSNYDVPNVFSIAAHNYSDARASFSCYGRNSVDVAAPGRNILSTVKNGGYAVYSGTSMATPHSSGVIGLLIANEGRLPLDELRDRVLWTSVPVRAYKGKMVAGGRINVFNLLEDFRPERNEPNPDLWVTMDLNEAFKSDHPYDNKEDITRTITVPGAKYVRVIVKKYELETRYDFLTFTDVDGMIIDKISGSGENFKTGYVEGETVRVQFTSDDSQVKWGFEIEAIEYQ